MAVRDATDGVGSRQGVLSGVVVAVLGDKVEGRAVAWRERGRCRIYRL